MVKIPFPGPICFPPYYSNNFTKARIPPSYNIIKVALSHFCCRTTVQSDLVSVSSQVTVRRSLDDSTKHIVRQPERTTGTAQSSVPVERQEQKAHPEPVEAECFMPVRQHEHEET